MSRTGEYYLEMAEQKNWLAADKHYEDLKNDEYECPHNTVTTEKMDGESVLICEDCGEDLTEKIIG